MVLAGWLVPGLDQAAWAQTATVCHAAAEKGTDGPIDFGAYCWIDFSPLNLAQAQSGSGQAFQVNLRGGAYLTFNLRIVGDNAAGTNMYAVPVPSWTGAAFGNSAFNDIPGDPILYQDEANQSNPQSTLTLSNITLHANGATELPFVFVAADGESSNADETVRFTTTGDNWALVSAPGISNPARNMPVLTPATAVGNSTGNQTVDIDGVTAGSGGGVGSFVFTTDNSPGTVTAELEGNGLQGALFGLKYHTIGLSLTKTHAGNFVAGGTGTYIINTAHTVQYPEINPPSDPQPVRVVDTLPAGLTYVSASGTGWSCSHVAQVVTCNTTSLQDLTISRTFPPITIKVAVDADAPSILVNHALVTDPTTTTLVYNVCETEDNGVCPNSATHASGDETVVLHSNLSTSTKTVVDQNGGDVEVGDVLRYTITLIENGGQGVDATGVLVVDDLPADVAELAMVSIPAGATDLSVGAGGANGTGQVKVSGITVPEGTSVTIVFDVTVQESAENGDEIVNTATITNGSGPGGTPSVSVVVTDPQAPVSGNKLLYLQTNNLMTRTPQTSGADLTIDENSFQDWTLSAALAKQLVIVDGSTVSVTLRTRGSGNGNAARSMYVQLRKGGVQVGSNSNTENFTSTSYTNRTFNISMPNGGGTWAQGTSFVLRIYNSSSGGGTRTVQFNPFQGGNRSTVGFNASTVVNVDSVTFHGSAYPANDPKTILNPGDPVYIRAVVSDPFGGYDVSAARITITDPTSAVVVPATAMTAVTSPSNNGTTTRVFEFSAVAPAGPYGTWTASVTADEGSEGTVSHTRTGTVKIEPDALLVTKSHAGDFTAGTNGQYTLLVSNTGAGVVAGTTTVKDTLVTGLAFVSGTGTGWTCGAAGQVVTCTSSNSIPGNSDMAPITLTVSVAGNLGTSVNNQAKVGNSTIAGGYETAGNVDTATVLHPDVSTSTKTVMDVNGGDAEPGDVLRYTITVIESANVAANSIGVNDPLQAGLASLSPHAGLTTCNGTDASTSTTLVRTGISLPAGGSCVIVFDAEISEFATAGQDIGNTATITNPNGPGAAPFSPTVKVSESQVPQSGNKLLYVYEDRNLSRVAHGSNSGSYTTFTGSADFTLSTLAAPLMIAGNQQIVANLWLQRNGGTNRSVYVQLYKNGSALVGSNSNTHSATSSWTLRTFTIDLAYPFLFQPGDTLELRVVTTGSTRLRQRDSGTSSTVSFTTSTVVNVDGVTAHAVSYDTNPSAPPLTSFSPGGTVYFRAVTSDPFGWADISAANIVIKDANGVTQQPSTGMTSKATSGATRTWEYAYVIPANGIPGGWTATVTALEGTEGTVSHNANLGFAVAMTVTLKKAWDEEDDNAGDTVSLTIAGGSNAVAGTSTADGSTTDAVANATQGATITLTEAFTVGLMSQYTVSLSCERNSDQSPITVNGTGLSRTITMPASSVTCTWSNRRTDPVTLVKLSTVYSDPFNGTSNPKAIPGALVNYIFGITAPGTTQVDPGSLEIKDHLPDEVTMFVADLPDHAGNTPVVFIGPASGLTLEFNGYDDHTDQVDFSQDGVDWTYEPVPDAVGLDPAVRWIRLRPAGTFVPASGAIILFRASIN